MYIDNLSNVYFVINQQAEVECSKLFAVPFSISHFPFVKI